MLMDVPNAIADYDLWNKTCYPDIIGSVKNIMMMDVPNAILTMIYANKTCYPRYNWM